jgi:signal transduction histidine kinase
MKIIFLNLMIALALWFLAAYIVLNKHYLRARLTCVILVGAGVWVLSYALEMLSVDLVSKLLWAKLEFVGVGLMHSFVIFLLHYFKDDRHINLRNILLLGLVPASMVALVFSDAPQALVFVDTQMDVLDPYTPLNFTLGPAYAFFLGYSYLLVLGAGAYVAVKVAQQGFYNRLTLVGWMGLILLPVALSFYTHFVAKSSVDYSPVAFGLVLIVSTLFTPEQMRLGNILPIEYASIVSGMDDMVLLVDRSSRIIHVNPSAEEKLSKYMGVSRDNVVGQDVWKLVEGGTFDSIGNVSGLETSIMGRSYDLSSFYTSNWKVEPSNLVVVLRDITERARMERQLQILHNYAIKVAAAESLEEVGRITHMVLHDSLQFRAGGLVLCEAGQLKTLVSWGVGEGVIRDVVQANMGQSGEAHGSRVVAPVPGDDAGGFSSLLFVPVRTKAARSIGVVVFEDASSVSASRELMLLETFAEHVASVIHRIDHEVMLEDMQRAEIKRILEGANRVASMVRHDLRGPLQTIRNASYLIRKSPENIIRMAPVIDKSVDYMVKVLEELRYTDSTENLSLVELDLNTLVRQSLKQIIVPEKVKVETVYCEPEIVYPVDKIRVHRVLDNLIRNAIEAMPEGGRLTITTSVEGGGVRLTVADTGVGIQNVDELFKPFVTTKKNGMGLGLVSCKYAVEAHGGTLSVESRPGEGTRFIIDLPGVASDGYEGHQGQGHDREVEQEAQLPGQAQR